MRRTKGLAWLGILVLLCAWATLALAQRPETPTFPEQLESWQASLESAEDAAAAPALTDALAKDLRAELAAVRAEAQAAIAEAEGQLGPIRARLDALGPPPGEGEPAEAEEIAEQREAIGQQIAVLDAHIKQSELVIAQSNELDARISAARRAETVRQLSGRFPLPLVPDTITAAVPEGFAVMGRLVAAPFTWWDNLSLEQRSDILFARTLLPVVVILAIIVGLLLRYFLLRWFRRDPAEEAPSYGRRLVAAIAKGVGDGAIPALLLGLFLYSSSREDTPLTGLMGDMVQSLCLALIILLLALALPRAVLAPDLPAWRLLPVLPENARRISYRITLLAAVFATDLFFVWSTETLPVSLELDALYGLVSTALEAVVLLTLLPASLWQYAPEAGEELPEDEREEMPKARRQAWIISRRLAGLIALAAIAASLLGYTALGNYLIDNLIFTGGVVGGLFVLRGLGRELIGVGLRATLVREGMELRHQARSVLKFWFRLALDIVALGVGIFLTLLVWGVPSEDLWLSLVALLSGFRIGNVTISLTDIATAIIVFLVIMALTRVTQRALNEKIFPRTRFDMGVRNSLSMALGYVGVAIAVMIGIATLGLDLSNLAIIAGALSVGIGFGLQAIVNNFVSGLILLIERPVKVGDWVIVGAHEGTVKRISVRATEIETFDRQSVIIPNSELISSAVGNWTHKDRLCRAIVNVGVAYGSDTEKVREVLLRCAEETAQVLKQPAPFVVFQNFGDSSLDFQLRCYLSDVDYFIRVPSELRFAIDKAFREEGIEIPFPQRDLHIKSAGDLPAAVETLEAKTTEAKAAAPAEAPGSIAKDMPEAAGDG